MDFGDGGRRPPNYSQGADSPSGGSKRPTYARWVLIAILVICALYGAYRLLPARAGVDRVTLRPGSDSGEGLQYGLPRRPGVAITLDGGARRPPRRTDGDLPGVARVEDDDEAFGTVRPVAGGEDEVYCPAVYEPVCGSDGATYSNECVLNSVSRALARRAAPVNSHDDAGSEEGQEQEQGPGLTLSHKGPCEKHNPTS